MYSKAPVQTQALGRQLGARLQVGDFVALCGPLGSGKTCFVQGLGEGREAPCEYQRAAILPVVCYTCNNTSRITAATSLQAEDSIMEARLLRCRCPRCSYLVVETATESSLLDCPRCCHRFCPSGQKEVPLWVLGVLAVLLANLCLSFLR